jgi:hypothetical protein
MRDITFLRLADYCGDYWCLNVFAEVCIIGISEGLTRIR